MWRVGNTPMWQVVVHDKMGGEFDGEIVTMRMTQKNVSMRTQKMWHVGNTPTWQVVVHDKMGGQFNGEINLRLKKIVINK